MTLPTEIRPSDDDPLEPALTPEERFEWVLRRMHPKAWAEFLTNAEMASMAESGQTGNSEIDDFLAERQAEIDRGE